MNTDSKDFKPVGKFPAWLKKGQIEALEKMIEFTYRDDRHVFALEGAAGTGKTTIIKELRHHVKSTSGFIVAAPTHKAVRVISNATGLEGITVHKLMGFRPNFNIDNFDPNRIQFDAFGKKHIENYNTIAIDEGSMLPRKLVKYITDEAIKHNVKIIFMGDAYQLPPVGETTSTAFIQPKDSKYCLKEIVRQGDDNPLSPLLADIRTAIDRRNFNYINNIVGRRSLKNGKGYLHTDIDAFQTYASRAFNNDAFKKDINWCKFVTYTNDNVAIWNKFIRQQILTEANRPMIVHDLFTCYNTIVDEFNDSKVINSEDYIVNDYHEYTNKDGIKGWAVQFQEVSTGRITPYLFVVDHSDVNNFATVYFIINKLIADASSVANSPSARSKKWEAFYKFRGENLLMVDIKDSETGKIIVGKDFDYGYALTSHKAQGSTYNHVFVNLQNMLYGNGNEHIVQSAEMINRLFYVGASRAKETLTILF